MSQASRHKNGAHNRAQPIDMNRYYMSGANATVPDVRYKNALRLKKNHAVKPRVKAEKRTFFRFPKLSAIAIIFLLGVLVAAQYTAIQTMGYRVNQAQVKLDEVVAVNEQLKQEYSALGDLKKIEKKATEEFGMVYPEKVVAYMPSQAESADNTSKGGEDT